MSQNISENLHQILSTLPADGSVTLVAVSKFHPAEAIREAYDAGQRDFGESRAAELAEKAAELPDDIRWHFIGHLQTNKVRQVVGKVDLIQSADRIDLLDALERECARQNVCQDILLEINIGREETKSGFLTEDIHGVLEQMHNFPHIRVKGLMAIPPISNKEGENSRFFQEICNLSVDISGKKYDNVAMECLSMGMSGDFADAIRCGSTMIRVGTAIFGARNYAKPHQ